MPMAPSALKWSSDSQTLYCIAWTWPDAPDDDSYRKKDKELKESKVKAYVIDDAMFRYWDNWIADGKRPVIFRVDAETGKHTNLFAGLKLFLPVTSNGAESYDISPDGKEICFTADSSKEIGMDFNLDLYTMPLEASRERKRPEEQPKNITTDNPVGDFNPVYSPSGGGAIVFLRQTTKFFYADRTRVMVHRRNVGRNYELTAKLDRSCQNPQFVELGNVLFEAEDKGSHGLFLVSPREDVSDDIVGSATPDFSDQLPAVSSEGKFIAFVRSSFSLPVSLYSRDLKSLREPISIEGLNDALRSQWDLGSVKNITYKGADNEDVQMWIVHPPKFDPNKKWPLLMVIHGGPHNGITTDFHFRWNLHLLASKGYVVACPNFHGSSGFGQKFTDSITGDMATKPFYDVMKATDYMEALPYIDKNRTAAAGASYGGYMMAWINGHADRFKALVCHAGVYNWHSMMASDIVRSRERALGALPWGDLNQIDKQSPQRFAANFKTPTLVMHGEKDFRVPVTQGLEFYNTLRLKGVPTRLVYFPDENHWISKPQNSRLWHREFFAWVEKYIGSGPTASGQ